MGRVEVFTLLGVSDGWSKLCCIGISLFRLDLGHFSSTHRRVPNYLNLPPPNHLHITSHQEMPTISLSWTDLALFGLTAGLIGSIVLIGRSTSTSSTQNVASDGKRMTASKKKKARSKKGTLIPTPPSVSSSVNPPDHSPQSSTPSPPDNPSKSTSVAPLQPKSSGTIPRDGKSVDPDFHPDFPPLSSASQGQPKKHENKPKRPFAERHKQPVRKTIVDDMIDPEVEKPLKISRVMNIVAPEPEVPISPTSDPEEGWEKVPDSKRSRPADNSISIGTTKVSRPTSSATSQTAQQTKRQRQNAKKKEAAKALKAADEADRLRQLALHKRDQERLKMDAQSPSTSTNKPLGKQVAGGMKSSIGKDGRLIWE